MNTSTPGTPLFGQKSSIANPSQEKSQFSLTGNITTTPNPLGSGGLFGKKET